MAEFIAIVAVLLVIVTALGPEAKGQRFGMTGQAVGACQAGRDVDAVPPPLGGGGAIRHHANYSHLHLVPQCHEIARYRSHFS